jgi:hypothetical protein
MSDSHDSEGTPLNRLAAVISVAGLVVLSFLAGSAVAHFGLPVYTQWLEPGFMAVEAQFERATTLGQPGPSKVWRLERTPQTGARAHDPDAMFGTYTTIVSGHQPVGHLIGPDGNHRHTWRLPFSEAWSDPPHVRQPVGDTRIRWAGIHVYPTGEVLAFYHAEGDTPYGYGLVKIDRDGDILWRFSDHVHHDVTVDEDGTIWTLNHDFRDMTAHAGVDLPASFPERRILDDQIVQLTPDGQERARVSLTELVAQAVDPEDLANWHHGEAWDLLHTNSVEPVSADFARHHDFAEPGQLLVSFREIDAIGLVDFDDEQLVWLTRGFWSKQHDPDPLENGNILLFGNVGHDGADGPSRVAEFHPPENEIVWSYDGSADAPLDSEWGGEQNRLPNGNTLIVDTLAGRMLEVSPDGEIVWSYHNPVRTESNGRRFVPILGNSLQRFREDELEFNFTGGDQR